MNQLIEVGDYVTVTNKLLSTVNQRGLVLEISEDKYLVLFNDNKKVSYRNESLSIIHHNLGHCIKVTFKDADYLVTPLDTIISLTTHRIMKWNDDHPNTKGILAIAYNSKEEIVYV